MVNFQGEVPGAALVPGEGGLHFLGTYAVYLAADGKVHLGGGTAASDFVALAALVKARLDHIQSIFDAHIHPSTSGTISPSVTPIGALASVAATKVKAT